MPKAEVRNTDRADRILDAAAELMLRLGYRKVTIEDVARQAGIGKGTVYLHWRSKETLFRALLHRASIALTEQILERLETSPEEIRPHRFLRTAFVITMRDPILHAMLLRDTEVLGDLRDSLTGSLESVVNERYFALMAERGFLLDMPHLSYAVSASMLGHYLIDRFDPSVPSDLELRGEIVAHTVRASFEPAEGPDRATVVSTATEISTMLRDLLAHYRERIYSHDPTREHG
ncbi:TetR family transcriptional regulator [Saccharopolyspora erythraea NRRL 2338]|uniref:HTH-type transcriptional regulator n=2 Tax=Saccharopolyspora erythraea TaxID=1836 RepID=A4F6A8_SACEN|nr:TetR/AcrR family transcriptional regulator [Saccharopolyspora erythraea]EQD88125.1 TetR family transcriptional regulator [Saccharopolyspora erythraea D]PFG93384.1 TetR family transcriptional regulator [Saccharopolyspora erythraea NRRL 2338]QRK90219.1 TetR/AcrR family transcriptional regulator [Saccharopolyspora erythraea]CAL99582.1 putative HTH-type transcriptional regulator [Saccharopolyspora erythraea NRRL 2338]